MVERITIVRLAPVVGWWLVVDLLRGEYGWPVHVALAAFFGGGFFLAKAAELAYRRVADEESGQ